MAVYYPQGVILLRLVLEDFIPKSKAKGKKAYEFTAVAKNLTVNLNSYREADTFSCTLDFKNFPFDPRTVRSAGISIFVTDQKQLFKQDNSLNTLKTKGTGLIFQGFVDTDKISLGEDNQTVNLEGRDFTSLLLDRPYFGPPVILSKPLSKVIQGLLDELDQTRFDKKNNEGIEVINLTDSDPILAEFDSGKAAKQGTSNGRPDRSYWDQIQKIVNEAGLIAYIQLDKLIISSPRVLYSKDAPKIFIYGGNVMNLEFERKLGRQKGINIRVLSLNAEEKKVIEARLPLEATKEWAEDIGVKQEEVKIPQLDKDGKPLDNPPAAPYLTFKVKKVKTKKRLIEIGQSIYEEVGRQQIEGTLTTKEMEVCDTVNNPFDSTLMRVGTPIQVDINQGDLKGLPDLQKSSPKDARKGRIKQFLIGQCYNPVIADALAEALVKFDTPFFTQEVEFTLDQESGWQMKINFVNFIELPKSLASADA